MVMTNKNLIFKGLLISFLVISLASCGGQRSKGESSLTGWSFNDFDKGAGSNYKSQPLPPGMVLVEGGAFTRSIKTCSSSVLQNLHFIFKYL